MSILHEIHAAAPATVPVLRKRGVAYALKAGVCSDCGPAVALAVTEAVTNVVLHAYVDAAEQGTVELRAWTDGGCVVVSCRDRGRGMVPNPDSPGMGVGMRLIAQSTSSLRVLQPDDGGTELRFTFPLVATD